MTVLDFEKIVPLRADPFPFTELQTKWIEALEGGAYAQGRSYLRQGKYYCCLGVLCEVAGLEAVGDGEWNNGFLAPAGDGDGARYVQTLPPAFAKAAGLRDHYGSFVNGVVYERERPTSSRGTLVGLNDRSPQVPFPEIARYLRADPWNVFVPVFAEQAA